MAYSNCYCLDSWSVSVPHLKRQTSPIHFRNLAGYLVPTKDCFDFERQVERVPEESRQTGFEVGVGPVHFRLVVVVPPEGEVAWPVYLTSVYMHPEFPVR